LSVFVNVLFGTGYSDLCYGYNAFWRDALPYMDLPDVNEPLPDGQTMLWGDGFEIETLVNVRVAGAGLNIAEVPSLESARIHGVSNLNAFADGRRVLRTIMSEYRDRHRRRAISGSSGRPRITKAPSPDHRAAGYGDSAATSDHHWAVGPTASLPAMVPSKSTAAVGVASEKR
jgi:hypothetical protein